MSTPTITLLVRKVSAVLETGDKTPTAIQHMTGITFKDIHRAINYMSMYGHIEHHGEYVHLRPVAPEPAPVEPSVDPAAVHEIGPTPAPVETPAPPVEASTPVTELTTELAPVVEASPDMPAAPAILTFTVAAVEAPDLASLIAERDALKAYKDDLLRLNANLRAGIDATRALLFKADNDIEHLHTLLDQKKRALRVVAAMGRTNAAMMAVTLASAKSAPAPVIDLRELHDQLKQRDAGLAEIRTALDAVGQTSGSLVERVNKLAADRDRWHQCADTSAASFRALSHQVPTEDLPKTVEVSL